MVSRIETKVGIRVNTGGGDVPLGAVGFDAPRRVCRLGRVHAGQSDGIAIPIEPDADGVAVDHTVHLGGAAGCDTPLDRHAVESFYLPCVSPGIVATDVRGFFNEAPAVGRGSCESPWRCRPPRLYR